MDIFLPKTKQILIKVLSRTPYKLELIEYIDDTLKEKKISNIQEWYLISDFNVNLLGRNKMLLKNIILTFKAMLQS